MKKITFAVAALSLCLSLVGCGGQDTPSTPSYIPSQFSSELFNEIDEKINVAQKSIGNLASSYNLVDQTARSEINHGEMENDPAFGYATADLPSFVNKQQQMLYIVSIVNYIREHLNDNSYGVGFQYDTLYEGAGFMETIQSLNEPIRQYNGPTPVLKFRFTSGENWLGFQSNWDYQSDFMKTNMEFWNMRILTNMKFVFDSNQKIRQIWVNYNFEGSLAFGCQNSLFDYENEEFYSIFAGNSNGNLTTFLKQSMIAEAVDKMNSGNATSDNLVYCSSIDVAKAKLRTDATAEDYVNYLRWVNRIDHENLDGYADYSELQDVSLFNNLYDEVYNKFSDFKFLTSFVGGNAINIDALVGDASNYAYWRSYFIYDDVNNTTYIPYLEREELLKCINDLKATTDDANTISDLNHVLYSQQASAGRYIGNYFRNGEDVYELVLSPEDTTLIFKDNLITYKCSGGFSYELHKNGNKVIRFSIVNGSATNPDDIVEHNFDFNIKLESNQNTLYLGSTDKLVITEIDPDPSINYSYQLDFPQEFLTIDSEYNITPLQITPDDSSITLKVTEETTKMRKVLRLSIKPQKANGMYDFSNLASEEKIEIIGKLEKFAYEHCLTGVPIGYYSDNEFYTLKFSNNGVINEWLLRNTNFLKGIMTSAIREIDFVMEPTFNYFPNGCLVEDAFGLMVSYNNTSAHQRVVEELGLTLNGDEATAVSYFKAAVDELVSEGKLVLGTEQKPKAIQFRVECNQSDSRIAFRVTDQMCGYFNDPSICDQTIVLDIGIHSVSDDYSLEEIRWYEFGASAFIKEDYSSTDIYDYLRLLSNTFTPKEPYTATIPTNYLPYGSITYNNELFSFDALLGALLGEAYVNNGNLGY